MPSRFRSLSLFASLSFASAVLIACSSSSTDSGSGGSTTPALDGTYALDSADPSAPFDQITFVDGTRYMIDPTGCGNGDTCKRTGWYTSDATSIAMHDDATDDVTSLSFSVLASEPEDDIDAVYSGDDDAGAGAGAGDDAAASGDDDSGVMRDANRTLHLDGLVTNTGSLTKTAVASKLLVGGKSMSRGKGLVYPGGTLVSEHLDFEGSCAFLRGCSTPSQGSAAGTVKWGCGGTACSDSEHWMAVPAADAKYCGQTLTLCVGTNCQTALVRDISNARAFEGSIGLLDSLGLPHGGQCVNGHVTGGFGGGSVKIKF